MTAGLFAQDEGTGVPAGPLDPFAAAHPAVPALLYAAILALTMCAAHPVLAACSLVGAVACAWAEEGPSAAARSLAGALPVAAVVALANPLFSASGSTLLFRMGPVAVYAESLAYGACLGTTFGAALLWFGRAALSLTSDRLAALGGGRAPTVSLMAQMVARLVPGFMGQGRAVLEAERACSAAVGEKTKAGNEGQVDGLHGPAARVRAIRAAASGYARATGVVAGLALEGSLAGADAMRARGWGATRTRTSYRLVRFATRDLLALELVTAASVMAAYLAFIATSAFRFYPVMSELAPWWGYVCYAAYMLVPAALTVGEAVRWR